MSKFTFTVDDKSFTVSEHVLTPREILTLAGLSPTDYYLVEINGKSQQSYKDKPDEQIHLHEHAKFISVYLGGTTVS